MGRGEVIYSPAASALEAGVQALAAREVARGVRCARFSSARQFRRPFAGRIVQRRRRRRRRLPAGQAIGARPRTCCASGQRWILALGLPVAQPTKLRTGEFGRWVLEQRADVALVVAYGRILPGDALSAPRCGCVMSRIAPPEVSGSGTHRLGHRPWRARNGDHADEARSGHEHGPTFACTATDIGPDETAADLSARLAVLGAQLVQRWLPAYVAGQCILEPQDDAAATLAPLLEKEHGRIDWSKPQRSRSTIMCER